MLLIVGGLAQGKLRYAKERFPEARLLDEKNFEALETEMTGPVIWNHFHLSIKKLCFEKTAKEIECLVQRIILTQKELIIISDEIGNGIVPLEETERFYREETGRLLCNIAQEAEEVVKITCGIPMKLK